MVLKIYTIFYITTYLTLALNPEVLKKYGIWEITDSGLMAIAFAGMLAYAFRFRILSRKFWEYYVYVFIIFELVYMSWLQLPLLEKLNLKHEMNLNNFFNICLMAPLVFALFRLQQQWDTALVKKAEDPA